MQKTNGRKSSNLVKSHELICRFIRGFLVSLPPLMHILKKEIILHIFQASMRRAQYKSAGVLPPVSGVARKIAISKIKKKGSNRRPSNQANQEVNSQSDTGPIFL
jgi:hypothetical protein